MGRESEKKQEIIPLAGWSNEVSKGYIRFVRIRRTEVKEMFAGKPAEVLKTNSKRGQIYLKVAKSENLIDGEWFPDEFVCDISFCRPYKPE